METLPGRHAGSDEAPVYDFDLDPAPSSDRTAGPGLDDAERAEARHRLARRVVDIVVVAAVVAFVFAQAGPRNLLTATTPAHDLCGRHATSLSVPHGWRLEDRRTVATLLPRRETWAS